MLICIYSFYPVLHAAARFFLKIVKMWVRPLVHDAIQIAYMSTLEITKLDPDWGTVGRSSPQQAQAVELMLV